MAAIDKIYGSTQEYDIFCKWAKENRAEILKYFYPRNGYKDKHDRPITNLPEKEDMWLLENCQIEFIIKRIKEQYGL